MSNQPPKFPDLSPLGQEAYQLLQSSKRGLFLGLLREGKEPLHQHLKDLQENLDRTISEGHQKLLSKGYKPEEANRVARELAFATWLPPDGAES